MTILITTARFFRYNRLGCYALDVDCRCCSNLGTVAARHPSSLVSSSPHSLLSYNTVVVFNLCWVHQLTAGFRPKKHAFHEAQAEAEDAPSVNSDEGQDAQFGASGGKGGETIKVNQIV